jgi:hypothetical protein
MPVDVSGESDVSQALGSLRCGNFHRFWQRKF